MQKTKAANFENIAAMSEQFESAVDPENLTPEFASYWQLRISLAIAQQLSMISAALKKGDE